MTPAERKVWERMVCACHAMMSTHEVLHEMQHAVRAKDWENAAGLLDALEPNQDALGDLASAIMAWKFPEK